MQWPWRFQLFLFDFDGLLVDTERLHYQAYMDALERFGVTREFSFDDFRTLAHGSSRAWREAILALSPALHFDALYQAKKERYSEILKTSEVNLCLGVSELLYDLYEKKIPSCVVTNSPRVQVEAIRARSKPLQTITYWITREDYEKPKPNPECYQKAIALYGKPLDRVVGFEDSLKGYMALKQSGAKAVLICDENHPQMQREELQGALRFSSLLIDDLS